MKNLVQLIAYMDRMSGGGFGELNTLLNGSPDGVFGGAHLLPFFTPIDGADAGFDPIDHTQVDARESDLLAIYRPRPSLPFSPVTLASGDRKLLWTTFNPEQVDIDVGHPHAQAYPVSILRKFQTAGIKMIRLDAVGYVIKKPGTSCFMIPESRNCITSVL
jgi:glycosidase